MLVPVYGNFLARHHLLKFLHERPKLITPRLYLTRNFTHNRQAVIKSLYNQGNEALKVISTILTRNYENDFCYTEEPQLNLLPKLDPKTKEYEVIFSVLNRVIQLQEDALKLDLVSFGHCTIKGTNTLYTGWAEKNPTARMEVKECMTLSLIDMIPVLLGEKPYMEHWVPSRIFSIENDTIVCETCG